jgi:hypothetical protein
MNDRQLALDLSVIPLIFGSDYRSLVDLSRGVNLPADGGDPHDDLLHLVMALNLKSSWMQMGANFASGMVPALRADPFGWIGSCAAIYFDDDPFWGEIAQSKQEDPFVFLEKNVHRMPVALYIECKSALKLAAFMTGVRAYIDQTVPGMTVWTADEYKGVGFVKVVPSEAAKADSREIEHLSVYYCATGKALMLSLREDVLKRAIDRQLAARAATTSPDPAGAATMPTTQPWLGSSAAMRVKRSMLEFYCDELLSRSGPTAQAQSWSNLPILNEWHQRYPKEDPAALHLRVWGTRLICPGGGDYVWDEQTGTMQSTVYGSPADPKGQPRVIPLPPEISALDAGLTFEEHGLRARVALQRKAVPAGSETVAPVNPR